MVYSIVSKKQLKNSLRVDAEYYQPEYLNIYRKLNRLNSVALEKISSKITDGDHGNPDYSNDGVPYIKSEDITEIDINVSNPNKVSYKYADKISESCFLQKNDVLLSNVGNIGLSTVNKLTEDLILSRDVARIKLKKDSKILPEYLSIFLNSYFGRLITDRESVGSVQKGLYLNSIKRLEVPRLDKNKQEKIRDMFLEARNHKSQACSFYSQAENLLLEKLGLENFDLEEKMAYESSFLDAKSANRLDPEYFQPKYKEVLDKLASYRASLGEEFDIIRGKNYNYLEGGKVGVLQTKQLTLPVISYNVEKRTSFEIVKNNDLPLLKDKGIIFASMGVGSLGRTNILYDFEKENKDFTIDSTLRIFRTKNSSRVLPEVAVVFLNSAIGQELIYKYPVGSSGIISLYQKDIRKLSVPVLPKTSQQKIANLVKKSHRKNKKADLLLEKAKQKVEDLVDKKVNNSYDKIHGQ